MTLRTENEDWTRGCNYLPLPPLSHFWMEPEESFCTSRSDICSLIDSAIQTEVVYAVTILCIKNHAIYNLNFQCTYSFWRLNKPHGTLCIYRRNRGVCVAHAKCIYSSGDANWVWPSLCLQPLFCKSIREAFKAQCFEKTKLENRFIVIIPLERIQSHIFQRNVLGIRPRMSDLRTRDCNPSMIVLQLLLLSSSSSLNCVWFWQPHGP